MSRVGHAIFAVGLALSSTNSALHVLLADRPVYAGSPRMFRGPLPRGRLWSVLGASGGFAGLIVLFLSGLAPEWVALGVLMALMAIRRVEIAQWHDDVVVRLGKYVPAGACLSGWLVADVALIASGVPVADARRLAWNAGCGVMAGAYVLAAITKVRTSGLSWVRAERQALLIAERAFWGPPLVRGLRLAIARSRSWSTLAGLFGLGVELAALAFVVPEARVPVAAAVIALHLGFMALLGYFEIEWLVVLVALLFLGRS